MGHSGHFLFLSFQHLTVNLIMTTFEQLTSGIRSNCSANWVTTTALTWSYLYIEKKFVKLPNFKIEKVEWDKNWHMGKTSRTCSKAATNVKIEILLESFRLKNVLKSRATVNFHMQDIVMSFEYVCIEQTTQAVWPELAKFCLIWGNLNALLNTQGCI